MRDLLKIGLVANIFEWYEFTIYAYLADVIGQIFFDASDAISGMMQAFAVFAIGYLARPLGSLFFSAMGDQAGRAYSLRIILLMAAIPTVLIGFLPTYQYMGLLAPALLVALRLIQGFAMGGEIPVNATYIFEAAPSSYKSILCSMVSASSSLGMLCAALTAFLLSQAFSNQTILSWAWRIPFLLSVFLAVGIGMIRRNVSELPIPLQETHPFRFHILKGPLLKTIALMSFVTVSSFTILIWMPSYSMHFLDYSARLARQTNVFAIAAMILCYLAAGICSRFLGYQRILKNGLILTIIFIIPLWLGLQQASFGMALAMQLLMTVLIGSVGGVSIEALAKQFPPIKRCRGINLAYTFPSVFLGGTTPLICTWMISKTGLLIFPALYIMFFGVLALLAVWWLEEG